jgi:hypothetical protein
MGGDQEGNIAVGIVMVAVIFAIAKVVQSGEVQITSGLSANQEVGTMVTALIIEFINLAIGLVAASFRCGSPSGSSIASPLTYKGWKNWQRAM